MLEKFTIPPDVKRITEGLRDTGYQFTTAIADIVDNSIGAGATLIKIYCLMDLKNRIKIFLSDNGSGMTKAELLDAMKYGSKPNTSPLSLSKYGLGLKTASTAFCRKLIVVSRDSKGINNKAIWDLDHLAKVNKWEVLLDKLTDEEVEYLRNAARDKSGTLVVWENVDRLIGEYKTAGFARKAFDKQIGLLKEHLQLVYQRFLDVEDKRAPNVSIYVNDEKLNPWDPFLEGVSELVDDKEIKIINNANQTTGIIKVRAFVLPRTDDLSDEMKKKAKIGIKTQGIYVYRQHRLISGPSWLGYLRDHPSQNPLRVEFSFMQDLDSHFHIDIKKSHIILNENLEETLFTEVLPPALRAAREVWTKGMASIFKKRSEDAHSASNQNIHDKEKDVVSSSVKVIDKETGEAEVVNKYGKSVITIAIDEPNFPGEDSIKAVDSIQDGLLWEPTIIEAHHAVKINRSHDFYRKVYIPNINDSVLLQGMDALLWALCEAELSTLNEKTQDQYLELRYEVSKTLRKLVKDLPEPDDNDVSVEL